MINKKHIITIGFSFACLVGLIAGIFSRDYTWYRTLNGVEQAVFGTPKTVKDCLRRICYIETRMADGKSPAKSEVDAYFPEFLEGGLFDSLYDNNYSTFVLVLNFVRDFKDLTRPQALIYLWFIRKNFDEKCDFSNKPGTAYNMLFFYLTHNVLLKTINKAEKYAGLQDFISLGCLGDGCEEEAQTAFACVDDPDCLDYPTCFACSMQ